jgi:hypothetical protein
MLSRPPRRRRGTGGGLKRPTAIRYSRQRAREGPPGSCGRGSVGRASPCQGEGRGFESRRPLGRRPRASSRPGCLRDNPAEWPSGIGKGLQSPVRGFDSRLRLGRLAQRESASLTRRRPLVRSQYRPRVSWVAPARGTRGLGATRHAGRGGDPRGPHVPAAAGSSSGRERPLGVGDACLRLGPLRHSGRGDDPPNPPAVAGLVRLVATGTPLGFEWWSLRSTSGLVRRASRWTPRFMLAGGRPPRPPEMAGLVRWSPPARRSGFARRAPC